MKILIVSPHRDDAAFSLGLAVEAWLAAGHAVTVLNCFTLSEYAPYSDVGSLHANDRQSFATAVRKREDIAWNKLIRDAVRFNDLDLLDAPLRLAMSLDEAMATPIRAGDRAVARVAGSIAKWAKAGPERAVVLPLAIGDHVDHRVAREAGQQALAELPVPMGYYEDLPYAARPEAQDRMAALAGELSPEFEPVFATEPVNLKPAKGRKRRIAECYDSQIDSPTAEQIAAFSGQYGGRERLWVNPAWRASALVAVPAAEVTS